MEWTKDRICALSTEQRHELWKNVRRLERDDLVQMIEDSGQDYADPAGLKLESPLGRAITRIINSAEGIAAAIDATNKGFPALQGVDPLLKAQLGKEYETTYEATIQAGYRVAQMMRKHGFINSGQGRLEGCVAKTGYIYTRIKNWDRS